jgi:hypothetical protein
MITYWLRFTLESDATFGRGDGVPGLVDQEVALDRSGCPYLHGRTLKGLLGEVCADILYALGNGGAAWREAADGLFGQPGSEAGFQGALRVGRAELPAALRQAVCNELTSRRWTREQVTDALTAIRYQTAAREDGAPAPHSLRSARVILRGTPFESRLDLPREPTDMEKGLLASCVKGLRRAGTARNRGRGRLAARLEDETGESDLTEIWYRDFFKAEVCR